MTTGAEGVHPALILGYGTIGPGPEFQFVRTIVDEMARPALTRRFYRAALQVRGLGGGYIQVVIGSVHLGFISMTGCAEV